MKLIVGLGNPGAKYETTRHNVGFLAIDRLIDRWRASGPITKFGAEIFQADLPSSGRVLLMKPQTYMNRSGQSVGPAFGFYQLKPTDLIVIHDDLDLDPLKLRFKTGGGAGGHNGIKSIDEALGKAQTAYHRVRVGIGHPRRAGGDNPEAQTRPTQGVADYVLDPFEGEELQALDEVLDDVAAAVELILDGQMQQAMSKFH